MTSQNIPFSVKKKTQHGHIQYKKAIVLNLSEDSKDVKLTESMKNARECESKGLSPGAGLATADEQSDAAYADLINTSIDQRGIDELSEDELKRLEKGGKMWEKGSKSNEPKTGFLGEVVELFKALNGGAHIEKNKFGET